jgi:hypothetical protein
MELRIKTTGNTYFDKSKTIDTFRNEIRYSNDGFVTVNHTTIYSDETEKVETIIVNIKYIIEFNEVK